jgi:hypothetical protein
MYIYRHMKCDLPYMHMLIAMFTASDEKVHAC